MKYSEEQKKAILEKRKKTLLLKYGVENISQLKEVREKAKNTMLERYGVENIMHSDKAKEKIKKTNMKKYGVDNPSKSKQVKQKISQSNKKVANEAKTKRKNTVIEKYGVENIQQNKEIKTKASLTNIERYGGKSPLQSNKVKETRVKNTLLKYSVENTSQLQEVKDKIKNTQINKYGKHNTQLHIPDETLEIISSRETLLEYLRENNLKSMVLASSKLGINHSGFVKKVHQFELYDEFDHYTSSYELELKELYSDKGITLDKTRTIINPYEIDLYSDKHKIGIEFNGDYWHSKLDSKYHQNKSLMAEKENIFIYHIFEHEWNGNKEKIIGQLDSLFGLNKTIYARNCELREVPKEIAINFLRENHLQGQDTSSIRYGLYLEDELVSIMTFGKPRFNKNYTWELQRFCNKMGISVVGGASKMFKHFLKNNLGTIISYSNIAKTRGTLYDKLGFKLSHISQPSYVWSNGINYKTRYQTQMKNEKIIMEQSNYVKVYDCGNKVWAYPN